MTANNQGYEIHTDLYHCFNLNKEKATLINHNQNIIV
jgi:hypothetical protein